MITMALLLGAEFIPVLRPGNIAWWSAICPDRGIWGGGRYPDKATAADVFLSNFGVFVDGEGNVFNQNNPTE